MKKTIALTALVLTLSAGMAMAQQGYGPRGGGSGGTGGPGMMGDGTTYGPGMMGGYGPGAQRGRGPGFGPGFQGTEVEPQVTREQITERINEHYNGFEVTEVKAYQMRAGVMHEAVATDPNGNEFVFRLNPWGGVMGPIPTADTATE